MSKKKSVKRKKTAWPAAILDIGSNSVRLVVFDSPAAGKPFFNAKVSCMLGRDLDKTGRLYAKGVVSARHAIAGFHSIARALGVKTFVPFTTAAVREAKDGRAFLRTVEKTIKTRIAVISGKKEAELSARGAATLFPKLTGVVCDLGGGSLELAAVKNGNIGATVTLPLGTLRLLANKRDAAAHIDAHLERIAGAFAGKGPLYIVGGSFRAYAKIHAKTKGKNGRDIHGHTMTAKDAAALRTRLRRMTGPGITDAFGTDALRAETMPHVAVLADRLCKTLGAPRMIVSAAGIREGVLQTIIRDRRTTL